MTTPTREQVIEWAKEAGLLNRAAFNHETELYRLCNLAFDAGREQGLREAKQACERLVPKQGQLGASLQSVNAPPPSSN